MDMQPSSYDDYDYSYYPPPPPYYPPHNDQYYNGGGYGGGSYRGGDDDSEYSDNADDDGDDSGDDDDGDDSGDDDDGDDSSDDDEGDDNGKDDDGDDSGDDDNGDDSGDYGNDDDSEEDNSEEYDNDEYDDGNDTDEYDHDDEDPDSGGTTNIGVIHGEDLILAVDSRATKNGVYKRDGKEMIQLTESIVLTRVGRVGVSTAIWEHLKEELRETSRYLTIEELANSGKEFADTITADVSVKCFIGGIKGGHPILYSFGYHYNKVLRSGIGFLRKIEAFATLGSGMVYARQAYENGMAGRGSSVSTDDVKEEVAFALLNAALEDGSTGGMLHVAQVSPTVGYQVTSRNSIKSYVWFFDRLGATNQRAVLAVYPRDQVSKEAVSNICSDYGPVLFEGHPLAKLRGNY